MDKYGISKSIFDNITTEHFTTKPQITNLPITNSQIDFKNTLDSYIENNFFKTTTENFLLQYLVWREEQGLTFLLRLISQ